MKRRKGNYGTELQLKFWVFIRDNCVCVCVCELDLAGWGLGLCENDYETLNSIKVRNLITVRKITVGSKGHVVIDYIEGPPASVLCGWPTYTASFDGVRVTPAVSTSICLVKCCKCDWNSISNLSNKFFTFINKLRRCWKNVCNFTSHGWVINLKGIYQTHFSIWQGRKAVTVRRKVAVEICRGAHEYFISSPHLFIADSGMWRGGWRGFMPFALMTVLPALCFVMWFLPRRHSPRALVSGLHCCTELVSYSVILVNFDILLTVHLNIFILILTNLMH